MQGGVEGSSGFIGWSPDGTNLIVTFTAGLTTDDLDGESFSNEADLFEFDVLSGSRMLLRSSVEGGAEGKSTLAG